MLKKYLLIFVVFQIFLGAVYGQNRQAFVKAPKPVLENLSLDKIPSSSNPILPHSVNAVLIGKMWNAYTTQASYSNQIFTDPFSGLIGVVHRIDRTGPGSGRIVYRGSDDGGQNWSPQIGPMNLAPWINGRHPNIVLSNPTKSTIPADPVPVAGWAELVGGTWKAYQFSADQSFGSLTFSQYIDSSYYPGEEMFINSQGHIFAPIDLIEPEADGTIYHLFVSTNKGLTWSKTKLAKITDYDAINGIKGFINKNGVGYLVLQGIAPGQGYYSFSFKKTTNDGVTWSSNWIWVNPYILPPLKDSVHSLNYEVDIIVDGTGNLHFAGTFVDTIDGTATGIYHIWGDGTNWQAQKVSSVNLTSLSLPGGLRTLNEVEFATNWDGTIVVLKWCDAPTPTSNYYDIFMTPVYGAPRNIRNITNTPNVNEKFSQTSAWGFMENDTTFRVDCMYTIFGNNDTNDLEESELWYLRNVKFIVNRTPNCIITWQTYFVGSNSCNERDTLIFGQSPNATNGIDPCLGEFELPPAPPSDIFYQRFILPNGLESKKDFRNDRANLPIRWGILLQKGSCGLPIKFNWKKENLPSNGTFRLKDGIGGLLLNVNMKEQDSLLLIYDIDSLVIEYTPIICKSVNVQSKWNILSVPVQANNMHKDSLFPGNISLAYTFENNSYVSKSILEAGIGYWLKFNNSNTFYICGLQHPTRFINVRSGWNMIGPFEFDVPTNSIISNPPNITISSYYGWGIGYFIADTLKVGKGYWVKCSSPGYLIIPTNAIMSKNNSDYNKIVINEKWPVIELSDQSGNQTRLFLANSNFTQSLYELPPTPPLEIFDARFEDNTFVTDISDPKNIIINPIQLPIKLRLSNFENGYILLSDLINGNLLNKKIMNNEEVIIDRDIRMIKLTAFRRTFSYELSQNYPNPFNSKTKISFSIPENQYVKLTIYNLLGEEIETLIDNKLEAGEHFIYFDASKHPSGVYVYKLKAGNFSSAKKMLLLK